MCFNNYRIVESIFSYWHVSSSVRVLFREILTVQYCKMSPLKFRIGKVNSLALGLFFLRICTLPSLRGRGALQAQYNVVKIDTFFGDNLIIIPSKAKSCHLFAFQPLVALHFLHRKQCQNLASSPKCIPMLFEESLY